MFAVGFFGRNGARALRSSIHSNSCKSMMAVGGLRSGVLLPSAAIQGSEFDYFSSINGCYYFGLMRAMSSAEGRSIRSKVERSSAEGRSIRSKVERRMRRESGKTLREIRRAKKLRKKLMTDEERLIYNLRRAKKKVALLLQRLKKYELPDFPPSPHDPELLTVEQLQAYKKIGFRNKNYVPVGVRGVFGGVVQNMHMHWKFHETVQVCCDNFPKEKIREMATMLARLSGGIVINIHNVKTIIMFRGRNYRQPKNLIPFNTLTKRKALFKARFEQALESQKLNIKKIEQQLRRMGVNPEDPVAMASIRRVAATFFNAIDSSSDSPYVFHQQTEEASESKPLPADDSDQEELDRFIAEIEDAADKEWEEEEAAEREETGILRYWNRENIRGRFPRYREVGNSEDEENSETEADDSSEIGNSFSRRNDDRRLKMTSASEISNESIRKNYVRPREVVNGYNSDEQDPETDVDDTLQTHNRFSRSKDDRRLKVSSANIRKRFTRSFELGNEDSSEEDGAETDGDGCSEMRESFCRRNNERRPRMTSASESCHERFIRSRNDDYSEEDDDEADADDSSGMRSSFRRKHDGRGSKMSSVTENDDDSGFEDLLTDLDKEMWRSESEESQEDPKIHNRPSSSGRDGRTDSAAEYVSSDED